MSKNVHHTINYIEFTVTDLAEGKRFFGEAFGWEFNSYGPEYAGIKQGDGESGGLCVGTVTGGGPLVVLFSDDLDGTLASVEAAGGTIVKPMFEFPGGRRFHFADPGGNELAVWGHLPPA